MNGRFDRLGLGDSSKGRDTDEKAQRRKGSEATAKADSAVLPLRFGTV